MAVENSNSGDGVGSVVQIWRFAGCEFDERRRQLRVDGAEVDIESKPLDVLRQLLINAGEVVTKDELLDAVWPGLTVVDGSLATAVSKLRKALGGDSIIVTVSRVGYRLAVPVHTTAEVTGVASALRLEAGDSIPGRDQWRLTRRLDYSPVNAVWLAEHSKTRDVRVFKFASDAWSLRGLKREVTLARLLRESLGERPDFVRLLEWHFEGAPYYIESEFVGPHLGEWADAHGGLTAIPLDQRMRLVRDAVRAVAAAHSIDVLHKDLKPTNILIGHRPGGEAQVKIADFGSATLLTPGRLDALGITDLGLNQPGEAGAMMGTVMYAAPEVLSGQSPSKASDVYALGVLLYQTAVGDFRRPLAPGWESDVTDPCVREDIADAACGDPNRRLADASQLEARLNSLGVRRMDRQREGRERAGYAARTGLRSVLRRRWAAVFVAASLIPAAGVYVRQHARAGFSPLGQERRIGSLAVLPLANLSGDAAQDYLADGLTEALIADLSKIRALRVISRTTVMQYKGARKPVPEIARELNVDGIVEGSVLRSGDRVRVTAQLVDGVSDAHVWSDSYDRDVRDILDLQRELARQVSHEIRMTVQTKEGRQPVVRVDPRAYDLYLRGRFFWNRRTRSDLLKAADLFQQAADVDPGYPQAYGGLADAYVELVGFGNVNPLEGIPKAKAAALQSIALNGSLAEPHAALAYAYVADWQWGAAETEFQRALELNPGYVVALYQYGFLLSMLGRHAEAIPLVQQALLVDPLSPIVHYRAGRVYYHARQYSNAAEQFERIRELDPADPLGLYGLGLVDAAQGRYQEAIGFLERGNLQRGFDVAAAFAAAGSKAEARRRLEAGLRRSQRNNEYVRPGWITEVYVALGDHDEAMRWLERGYQERDAWLALLKVWPPFDPLRSDSRFQALLRRLNLPSDGS